MHYNDDVAALLLGMEQEIYDDFDNDLLCDLDGNDIYTPRYLPYISSFFSFHHILSLVSLEDS